MISINVFFKKNHIEFASTEQGIRWIKRLKPKTLVKVGRTYFVSESEILKLFQNDLKKKQKLRMERIETGKKKIKNLQLKTSSTSTRAKVSSTNKNGQN